MTASNTQLNVSQNSGRNIKIQIYDKFARYIQYPLSSFVLI